MIYRVLSKERMYQAEELWDYCFEKKTEPFFQYYFEQYCGKDNMVIGGFDKVGEEETLRTMLHVNPYMLHLRGQEMLVPYLVGIATAPEARGQHLLRPLLETAFEVLRSQGFPFVTLMPISAGIYLPYEFAYCYYRHEYKMPLAKLRIAEIGEELDNLTVCFFGGGFFSLTGSRYAVDERDYSLVREVELAVAGEKLSGKLLVLRVGVFRVAALGG